MSNPYEKISVWAFLAVILISIFALAGWLANLLSLAGMGENSIPMAPVTLICFILISLAAINLLQKRFKPALSRAALFCVLVLCLVILFDTATGYSIDLERIFGNSPGSLNNFPIGRISPVTSVLFLIGALSLLVISTKNSWNKAAILLSTAALFAAFTFGLGYLYGTPLLYGRNIIPPAWNTSLAFTFLFIGILVGFGMKEKPTSLFVGGTVRARLMRGFLPLTLLLIIIAGWIDVIFIHLFSDPVLISALVTIISLLALSFIILKMAKNIGNDIDSLLEFRKKAEETMRESELHFRTLADSGQALIWTSGLDKKCNYFNQPWLDFTGRSLEQEMGDGWVEGVHPDDLRQCVETYAEAFECRERFSMDYRLRYRDGSYRWIQDNGTPRFNSQGEFIGYIGHCLDITDKKYTEEKLVFSELRFRELLEKVNLIAIVLDADGNITFFNEYAAKLTEYKPNELIGKNWFKLMIPENYHKLNELSENGKISNNIPSRFENPIITKSGKERNIVWSNVSQYGPDGAIASVASIGEDITERKKAEEKIKTMNEELEGRVVERTKELEMKNTELARMNKLFVGREIRMVELKNEIKELEKKLKEPFSNI